MNRRILINFLINALDRSEFGLAAVASHLAASTWEGAEGGLTLVVVEAGGAYMLPELQRGEVGREEAAVRDTTAMVAPRSPVGQM